MKFPDVSRLGVVTVPDAGHFTVLLVREDLTPGEAAGFLRGKIARAKYPLDAYDAGIQDVIDATRRAALVSEGGLDYAARVEQVAAALHADCLLEWQAAAVVDPGRLVTQHMADAHYGQAHGLVRRIWPELDLATPTEEPTDE